MSIKNPTKAFANMWSIIMILIGMTLISNAKSYPSISNVLEFTGATFIGVFAVSLFYQVLIAEQHFNDFKKLLTLQLKEMDSIQSKCHKLCIIEIFETRNEYERQYPLMDIIKECPENGEITCIAKSLSHLINKTSDLKEGLKKGLTFKLACMNPDNVGLSFKGMYPFSAGDINSTLETLKYLIEWATENKVKGSIELKYHNVDVYGHKIQLDFKFALNFSPIFDNISENFSSFKRL